MAGKKLTKSQFVAEVAEKSGLSRKDAGAALEAMNLVIIEQLGKQGPGEVIIPGLLRLNKVEKPAVPARQGINPFTREPTTFKARPVSRSVRARPVKALKDAI